MPDHFAFIGNIGTESEYLFNILGRKGVSSKRMDHNTALVRALEEDMPSAVVFDHSLEGLEGVIEGLRGEQQLASLPLLVRVPAPDPDFLVQAFKWGVDDYLVDGSAKQFSELVSAIQKKDSWDVVRAPAGQVILAHSDRFERVKYARVLRRNGFDPFFCGTSDEVAEAMKKTPFRVIIASSELPGVPLETLLAGLATSKDKVPPWIIVAPSDRIGGFQEAMSENITVRLYEAGEDAEGVTFLVNEVLAPPSAGARRSERVLYGTPVTFAHKSGEVPFNGFSFNINSGGIYIRSLTPLPLQTKIEIRFRPPFGRGQLVADAQVVWRKQLGDESTAAPPGMGVQFLDMWQADRAAYETGYELLLEQRQKRSSLCGASAVES